jgi:hypothetical protein
MDDPKKFNASMIRGKKVLYTPGMEIKRSLDDMHFEQE